MQLQLVKESEMMPWWNRNRTQDGPPNKGYNEVIIIADIPYEFTIPPNSKQVYQLHSKNNKFMMDISSHLPLELCMTEDMTKPPFAPNCEVMEHLSKNKIYDVTLERGKIGNIGVTNNNDKEVKMNIHFTGDKSIDNSTDNPSDRSGFKCLPSILGKINKFNFKKDTWSCYSYFLDKVDDL